MSMKDFNFKQFMLQKGEWVGLGIAAVIMLPVLGLGMMKILTSRNPASNAQGLEQMTKSVEQLIKDAKPPADAAEPPKEFFTNVTYDPVDPVAYNTPVNWFIPSTLEDTRRRSPEILPPGEFHADVVRAGMMRHILDASGKRVMVLSQKPLLVVRDRKTKKIYKLDQKLAGAGSSYGRGMPPGVPGGERGGPSGAPGMSPGVGTGGLASTSYQDIEKVGTSQDVRLAEEIYPLRMVVVNGTFPFRQQMEEFRRALKKHSLEELFAVLGTEEANWQFLGFKIQRHVLYPDGREKTPWQDYDAELNARFAGIFAAAVDYEKEEPDYYKYEGILNKGLVMVRPQLDRGQYPKVELESIKNTISKLDKESQGPEMKRPLSDLARKLKKQGVNIYDPLNPLISEEEEEANKAAQPNQPPPDSSDKKSEKKDTDADAELLIPDKALVRFIDVNVEPGLAYEYRIKVKMANPNYHQKKNLAYAGLAEKKEIEASEWTLVPKVEVPQDIYYYVMDEKPDREQATVQIHRWVDYLLKDPQKGNTSTPLGDWTIAEKLPVRRGEYMGRLLGTKVPVWNIEKEDYELAVNPKNRNDQKIQVDYTVRTSRALDPALLVDYQGGKDFQDRLETRTADNKPRSTLAVDTVPVQMLILTPEGRLVVRNYQDDNSNEERVARHKAWKDWINEVQSGRRRPKPDEPLLDQFRGGGKIN
jgi:hypothetical protein